MKILIKWDVICLRYFFFFCRCVYLWWFWYINNFRRYLEVFVLDKYMVKVIMFFLSFSVFLFGWYYFGKVMNLFYFKVSCIVFTVFFLKWGVRVLYRKKILFYFFRDSVFGYIIGVWLFISYVMKVVWVYFRLILLKVFYF